MKPRHIALALAAAFPLIAATACDTEQPAGERTGAAPDQTQQQPRMSQSEPQSGAGPTAGMQQDEPMTLAQLDKDQDGSVSRSEAQGRIQEQFAQLDTDGDGQLSQEELQAAQAGGASAGSKTN